MKVALINPFKFQGALIKKNEPVGLNYLKHYANKYGYTVDVFDFETIEYVDDKSILKDISSSYDIIGISCYYPFLPEKLASQIKAMKSNIII